MATNIDFQLGIFFDKLFEKVFYLQKKMFFGINGMTYGRYRFHRLLFRNQISYCSCRWLIFYRSVGSKGQRAPHPQNLRPWRYLSVMMDLTSS